MNEERNPLDLKTFSTKHLEWLVSSARKELDERKKIQQVELWNKVLEAMKEYCEHFDHFEITCGECGEEIWVNFQEYRSDGVGELILKNQEEWGW